MTNIFSGTYRRMFPRFRSWGRLQTYSPQQLLRHRSPDRPLVLLVVLVQLESVTLVVHWMVVDAHEYYIG
jgi:hypothetical protein